MRGKIATWWMPDDVVFVDAIPLGATGKMQKNKLREQFSEVDALLGPVSTAIIVTLVSMVLNQLIPQIALGRPDILFE